MGQPPKKKIRENPLKKWRDYEILKMLEYISVHSKSFEKPTARAYYTKMIDEIKIDATWDLVKWKMRYIKQKFYKALELQKSIDPDHDNSVQDKILNMCPHFDLLTQIFGAQHQPSEYFDVFEPEDSNSQSIIKTENYIVEPMRSLFEITYDEDIANTTNNNDDDVDDDVDDVVDDDIATLQEKHTIITETTANNDKTNNSTTTNPLVQTTNTTQPIRSMSSSSSSIFLNSEVCLSNLSESERAKYFENMFDLEKRKIDMEEYKIKRELEMYEIKLKHEFEIRKLEIEKDERVAKYEIEMKYKYRKQFVSDI